MQELNRFSVLGGDYNIKTPQGTPRRDLAGI